MTAHTKSQPHLRAAGRTGLVDVEVTNHFASCLDLALEGTLTGNAELVIHIDVDFGTDWASAKVKRFKRPWRFQFGLKSGELKLCLVNLRSDKAKRASRPSLDLEQEVEHATSANDEISGGREIGAEVGASETGAGGKVVGKIVGGWTSGAGAQDTYTGKAIRIQVKGVQKKPVWSIEHTARGAVLQGRYAGEVATLDIIDHAAYGVDGKFKSSIDGIVVTEVDQAAFRKMKPKNRVAVVQAMKEAVLRDCGRTLSSIKIYERT